MYVKINQQEREGRGRGNGFLVFYTQKGEMINMENRKSVCDRRPFLAEFRHNVLIAIPG